MMPECRRRKAPPRTLSLFLQQGVGRGEAGAHEIVPALKPMEHDAEAVVRHLRGQTAGLRVLQRTPAR